MPVPPLYSCCEAESLLPGNHFVGKKAGVSRTTRTINCLASFRGLSGDVVWRADGENALVAADQERPFKEACTLIVQEIFVPAIFDQFGNDDNNMTSGVLFRELQNVLNQGNNNEAVETAPC